MTKLQILYMSISLSISLSVYGHLTYLGFLHLVINMNSNATLFEPHLDNVFGPQVNGDSDTFDFTLLFEQSILTIGPSALLLLVFPLRIAHLYQKDIKVRPGLLLVLKLVF